MERRRPGPAAIPGVVTEPEIRALPGTYALLLRAACERRVRIGRLGWLPMRRGFLLYVGSAFGPGGVRGRVSHHLNASPGAHWHVDYLRGRALPCEIWYCHDPRRREHEWAERIRSAGGASVPLAGFGSSDCGCVSHLHFFRERPSLGAFRRRLRGADPSHAPIWSARPRPRSSRFERCHRRARRVY